MKKRESQSFSKTESLYGVNPVFEALRGDRKIEEIVVAEGARHERLSKLIDLARAKNIPVSRAPRAGLNRASGNANHQGVIARVSAARYADTQELLNSIASRVGSESEPLVVVLDGVEDPRNLGAILRTGECAGVHGLFISERRAVGLTETAAKTAAGAVEYVPVARVTNLARLIEELKERNVWVVGTTADASMVYTEWDWTRASAVVLGGEGSGLRRLVRERCDALVRIPTLGRIDSLNVSVAAGVVFYEAVRQRMMRK